MYPYIDPGAAALHEYRNAHHLLQNLLGLEEWLVRLPTLLSVLFWLGHMVPLL
jgi:hypothetical protein